MRVFLDANILFSAAAQQSATRQLLERLLASAEVVTNEHALEEARRNLRLKRTHDLAGLTAIQEHITLTPVYCGRIQSALPAEDIPILVGAVGAVCSHLWTSDRRHFGRYYGKQLQGVQIVSSLMLADLLSDA